MASNIFIQFSNGVKGESEDEKHPGTAGWSELSDIGYELSQKASLSVETKEAQPVKGKHEEMTIAKHVDTASAHLLKGSLSSPPTTYDDVKIELYRASSADYTSDPIPYLVIELKKVLVKEIKLAYKAGEIPEETIKLEYNEFKFIYTPVDKKTGARKPSLPYSHKLKEG